MSCATDEFEQLTELFRARAQWPPAAKIAVLVDMECLRDNRLAAFLLDIVADPLEDEAVRMHALRWFRCGSCAPSERCRVASTILRLTRESDTRGLRLHAVLAIAQFADVPGVQTSLGALMLDQDESLDLRYGAFTSLEKAGLTPECRAALDRLADDTALGPSARKALSLWRTPEPIAA